MKKIDGVIFNKKRVLLNVYLPNAMNTKSQPVTV